MIAGQEITLDSSFVVQGMRINCGRVCASGPVDEAVSGKDGDSLLC